VILLDLDQFKRINDSFGHACGDEALKTTAKVIQRCVREHDLIARWGGEEFLLLLPETDIEQATALAERLRRAIADNRLRHQDQEIAITASMGVATMEPRHTGLEELISNADKCLYQAKAAGRNRVSVVGPQGRDN
jgi:diguanylate cyclase (GGDEF)-like protein